MNRERKNVDERERMDVFKPSPNPNVLVPEDLEGTEVSLKLDRWYKPGPNPDVLVPEDVEEK